MSFLIHAYRGRTRDFTGSLFESDGTTEFVLAAGDVVRVKIGTNGSAPDLDIDSDEATPNGSVITFTAGQNDYTLRLAQGDLALLAAGAYDMEVNVVDDSETAPADAIKLAEIGAIFVHPSQTGLLDIEESSSSGSSAS